MAYKAEYILVTCIVGRRYFKFYIGSSFINYLGIYMPNLINKVAMVSEI